MERWPWIPGDLPVLWSSSATPTPLVISRAQADEFADALDDLLSRGVVKIVTDFLKAQRSG